MRNLQLAPPRISRFLKFRSGKRLVKQFSQVTLDLSPVSSNMSLLVYTPDTLSLLSKIFPISRFFCVVEIRNLSTDYFTRNHRTRNLFSKFELFRVKSGWLSGLWCPSTPLQLYLDMTAPTYLISSSHVAMP